MSRAAINRLQIVSAEDIGAGDIDLTPSLMKLEEGWPRLERLERARRLVQAAKLMTRPEGSRFLPHWLITLIQRAPRAPRRTLRALLDRLDEALTAQDLDAAGLLVEEIFLRRPLSGESLMGDGVDLPADALEFVWGTLERRCPARHLGRLACLRRRFGPPSKASIAGRLILYSAVMLVALDLEPYDAPTPETTPEEARAWLARAEAEAFELPDWMFDRHTKRGRGLGRGYDHFFEVATRLCRPSAALGLEVEAEMRARARRIYAEEEARYGAKSSTKHMRARWREEAARCA